MTNVTTSEYAVDPSLYYPAATSYGYYCTGFESPGEWDENYALYGVDGTNVQYVAQDAQPENMPYVYYAPNYGYGESQFNPYNPYIPGAMIGVDGSYAGTQSYYVSPYSDPVSSSGYIPVLVQPGTNAVPTSSTNTISDVGSSTTHRVNVSSNKSTHLSTPASVYANQSKPTSSQIGSLKGASQISKANAMTTKRPTSSRTNGSGGSVSSRMPQELSLSLLNPVNNLQGGSTASSLQPFGTLPAELNQAKFSYPIGGSLLDYTSTGNSQSIINDQWSKYNHRRAFNDLNGYVDPLSEQNRGPRTIKSNNQIIVKAYTTKAGNFDSEENILISADEYNKDDFQVDYVNAKFFVIKSYSEDDVHKSIKYNVWSSTPNGNKKLNSAYEDAQKVAAGKSRGCPIFLFFSVNASGQFCGVAEMMGPVEFDRDMDFWQQDKWSGSFPVKWHIVKDVSNPTFRHIILENNEYKPVTNSRDTQEIFYKPGLEMLKVFKNYKSKTSLLDDFIYYEKRQKIMYEDRSRLLRRSNNHAHSFQLNHVTDHAPKDVLSSWVEKTAQHNYLSAAENTPKSPSVKPHPPNNSEVNPVDIGSTLKIGSLSINPKQQVEQNPTTPASSASNFVTVGKIPVKVDPGLNKSSGTLTIGTIALDPKSLENSKSGFLKGSSNGK